MACNSKKTIEADFSSVASTIAAIELATPLAYDYPEFTSDALLQMDDPSMLIPSIRFGNENLTRSIERLYDEILRNDDFTKTIIPQEYPSLNSRIDQPTLISYTELADFLTVMAYPDLPTFDRYMVNSPRKVMKDLDHYYESEMSGSALSLCSLLENPFAAIGAVVDMIDGMQNVLSMLPAIAGRLQSFAETIKAKVEDIFETMKDVVANLGGMVDKIGEGISKIPAVFAGLAKSLSNQFAALQNLFSEANLQNIKEGIDKFVTKAVKQFQKILENPEVILYLLYMFCKTASFIESALKNPVNAFQTMVGNVQTEQNLLRVHSAPTTRRAIEAGRPVATEASIDRIRTQAVGSHNAAVSGAIAGDSILAQNVEYVHQQQYLKHPHWTSWSNLRFEDSVVNNSWWLRTSQHRTYEGTTIVPKETGISPAIGYYKANLRELEMLNEIGRAMGKTLTINSAFRHPYYNKHIGGARNSCHMNGIAFDVRMAGIDRKEFCALAHRIGFRGFGGYPTFIHVDTGARRSWGRGYLPRGPWI